MTGSQLESNMIDIFCLVKLKHALAARSSESLDDNMVAACTASFGSASYVHAQKSDNCQRNHRHFSNGGLGRNGIEVDYSRS